MAESARIVLSIAPVGCFRCASAKDSRSLNGLRFFWVPGKRDRDAKDEGTSPPM
jgi:hypothetical protein